MNKSMKCLYCALVAVTAVMFLWTVNYIESSNNLDVPVAITAFNA